MNDAAPATTSGNGSSAPQAPVVVPPKADIATGPQAPTKPRAPDGKFAKAEAAEPAAPAKLRIKDLELDEESAHAEIMRGRANGRVLTEAQKRLQRAEQLEQGHAKRLDSYKSDLSQLFKDAGLSPEDAKRIASEYLYKNHIEPGTLTPEQTALREAQAKLQSYEAKEKEAAEARTKTEQETTYTEQAKEIEQVILGALKSGDVPSSRYAVARMASKMEAYERRGAQLSPEQVAGLVREDYGQEFGQMFGEASVDDIRALVGDKAFRPFVRKVLAWGLAQGPKDPTKTTARAAHSPPSADARKRITPQQFQDLMKGK